MTGSVALPTRRSPTGNAWIVLRRAKGFQPLSTSEARRADFRESLVAKPSSSGPRLGNLWGRIHPGRHHCGRFHRRPSARPSRLAGRALGIAGSDSNCTRACIGGRGDIRILDSWQRHSQSDCSPIPARDTGSIFMVSSPPLLSPPSHSSRICVAARVPPILILTLLLFLLVQFVLRSGERKGLAAHFGELYEEYRSQVSKWLGLPGAFRKSR